MPGTCRRAKRRELSLEPEADELQVDPVAVGFVIFLVAAAGNAEVVGDQERSKTALGVVGEVVAVEDAGRGVGNGAGEQAAGREISLRS
jgi:hypothetical protein